MFEHYSDRLETVEIDVNTDPARPVDIALYDSFAQPLSDLEEFAMLVGNDRIGQVVIYTWNFDPGVIRDAVQQGVRGYLSKALPARELVTALEAVHAGEMVVSEPPRRTASVAGLDWPGRHEGITDRESEILALITQGKSNAEIAELTYLSPNTVKTYIRSVYSKIEVKSRTQAVLWGVAHGFTPGHRRIDYWRESH